MSEELVKPTTMSLNGVKTLPNGDKIQTNYFDFLDIELDDYSDIVYTQQQATKIKRHMLKLQTGATAAIPLICPGANLCPFANSCPIVREDKLAKADAVALEEPVPKSILPVGRRCQVEVSLLTAWTRTYIQEYEVDPSNFSDFQLVQHLAETELLLWRINNNMAKLEHAEMTQENLMSVDQQGNPITNRVVSVVFELQEKLLNRKQKLIRLMVGDRQEKYKRDAALKTRSELDASASAADLRGRLTKMVREAEHIEKKLQQAEAIVVDGEYHSKDIGKSKEVDSDYISPEDLINQG